MRQSIQGRISKLSDKEIIRLYVEEKKTIRFLAELANIHHWKINILLMDNNIKVRGQHENNFKISDDEMVRLYIKESRSTSYIAKEANCAPKTVERRLRRKKIALRRSAHKNGHAVKEHTLYILTNAAYPGWIKVGRTTNLALRLSTYQTSSPFRNFKVEYNIETKYALQVEWYFKHKYNSPYEWYEMSVENGIIEILNSLKEESK